MSFANRLQGVFFNPQPTFKALSEKPVWIDALIIILIFAAVLSSIAGYYGFQDRLKDMENNPKYADRMEAMKKVPAAVLMLFSGLSGLIAFGLGFLIAALVLLVMGRLFTTEGSFLAVFSALLHANFIDKILGSSVRVILILVRKSATQATTSLAILAPHAAPTSNAFVILSQFDFFQLWMFWVLGYGLSAVFKIPMKKSLAMSYGFWLLKSLVLVAISLLSRSIMS